MDLDNEVHGIDEGLTLAAVFHHLEKPLKVKLINPNKLIFRDQEWFSQMNVRPE